MSNSESNVTLSPADYERYLQKGIDYDQYKRQMAEDLATNSNEKTAAYIQINQRRMHRVEKTYEMSAELLEKIKKLNLPAALLTL